MLRLAFIAALLLVGWVPHASSAPSAQAGVDAREPEVDDPSAGPLRQRAQRILELIDGTLDPELDAEALLVLDLSDPALMGRSGERLSNVLRGLEAPSEAVAEDLGDVDGAVALERALLRFLRLPDDRRREILDVHAARREALSRADAEQRSLETRLAAVRTRADQLEAYLAGELDPSVELSAIFELDLADAGELGLSSARRKAWLEPVDSSEPEPDAEPTDRGESAAAELEEALARLDGLRQRYLELSAAEKTELLGRHRLRQDPESFEDTAGEAHVDAAADTQSARVISAAEDAAALAAAQRELALESARQAKTEALRIVAEEKARLLGIKESFARYEAAMGRFEAERATSLETVLEWKRHVAELRGSLMFETEKAARADPMYREIRSDLAAARNRLREQLRRVRSSGADLPTVGEGLDRALSADVDRSELDALRAELADKELELRELAFVVDWELARAFREDVVQLNRSRLELLEMATAGLRASVTGFGPDGLDQVERELEQISVELAFHSLKLLRYKHDIVSRLKSATIPLLFGAARLAVVLMLLVWWRRVAPGVLSKMQRSAREQRPSTRISASTATMLWYLRRVRKPLELLLVVWIVFRLIGNFDEFPELVLLWRVALWSLVGTTVILFVDALAARETLFTGGAKDTSVLRIHSLRVVGLTVIAIGMILSLTSAMVGKGAIYSWVLSTCWISSFPVALYLVHRWRPIVFERIDGQVDRNGLTKWVVTRRKGASSFAAAAVGAGYLLASGFAAWAMRQLAGLETTRKLLAYLFKREVARRAAAMEADQRFTPIEVDRHRALDPEHQPDELLEHVAAVQLERVAKLAVSTRSTLTAVVGERGLGKSAFARRLASAIGGDRVRVVQCPEEGFTGLERQLAELVGAPSLRGEALRRTLRETDVAVIVIDDIQRLVVPAVNGLLDLDAFTSFAREVGGELSWVVTIEAASWHFVRRARGERVFFEQVVALPRWSEEDLGKLIRRRCTLAGIDPSFDGLVVPRQADAPAAPEGDRTETGYYRLLWDYSAGNPAVALHAFGASLFETHAGNTVVRLFRQPSSQVVEDLPMTVLFVLRAIAQLELAVAAELERATQLPRTDVDDALRFCLSRGYIEPFESGVRLSWPWYRTITTVLVRQHLLPST